MKLALLALACVGATAPAFAQREIAPLNFVQPEPHDIVITGNDIARDVTCDRNSVYIEGQHNEVQVHGSCKFVRIQGERNYVWVDRVTVVPVEGNNNTVFVADPETKYSSRGDGNRFAKGKH